MRKRARACALTILLPALGGAALAQQSGLPPSPALPIAAQTISGTVYSYQFPQTGLAERVNACVAAAQALTSPAATGVCDASAESGRINTDTEIDVGSSAGTGVGLILPCQAAWVGNFTSASMSVMKIYGGATVRSVCPSSGPAGQMGITTSSSSSVQYVVSTVTATNPYLYLSGFNIINVTGGHATSSGIGFYFSGPLNDGTTLDNLNVNDSLDTYCAKAYNISAATTWQHSSINCGNNGTSFWASTDSGGYVQSLVLEDMTIVHSGAGNPEVLCTDTRAVTPHISYLVLDNDYTETGTDGTTADVQIQGCNKVVDKNHIFKSQSSGRTATAFTVTNTYNTDLEIDGATFSQGSGTYTYPVTVVNNSYTGEVVQSDSLGHFGHYSPLSVPSQLSLNNGVFTITASATPAISLANGHLQTITLSANASPTISGITAGSQLTLEICQPSSGGPYTWTWPASIHGGVVIGTTASTCSIQSFQSISGSTLIPTSTGVVNVAP